MLKLFKFTIIYLEVSTIIINIARAVDICSSSYNSSNSSNTNFSNRDIRW